MEISLNVITVMITLTVNVVAIAYFAGVLKTTQEHHARLISDIKEHIKDQIDELRKKQEKHNDLINRTFILEEQMKVANHRIQDLEE